jgi:hypothetical protein
MPAAPDRFHRETNASGGARSRVTRTQDFGTTRFHQRGATDLCRYRKRCCAAEHASRDTRNVSSIDPEERLETAPSTRVCSGSTARGENHPDVSYRAGARLHRDRLFVGMALAGMQATLETHVRFLSRVLRGCSHARLRSAAGPAHRRQLSSAILAYRLTGAPALSHPQRGV